MGRTYSVTKKRGKRSVIKRLRDRREKSLKLCLSDEYVAENCHVTYYNITPNEELPDFKIELVKPNECDDRKETLQGRRMVDINYFIEKINKIAVHDLRCTAGKMKFIGERRVGLVSHIKYFCDNCNKTLIINTQPGSSSPDINESFVWGSLRIGIGFAQLQEFLAILDVPNMSRKTFMSYEHVIGEKWQIELCQQMKKAAEEELQLAIADDNVENGVPYITVVVDGGWAKRSYGHGYSSMSGVACIIGARTKKLLFIGVRNKFCYACAVKCGKEKHVCFINYEGPPTSMEQDIIVEGFNRSEIDYKLRYKYMIGDGDSSVYAKIIQNVSYGRSVCKLECANHVTRAFTSNLHKIVAKTNFNIEARRILKTKIPRFSINVRTAICRCTNLELLKQDLRNLPYHIFGFHANCRDAVCKRKLSEEDNFVVLLQKANVFQEVEKIIDNVVRKADRVQKNVTTNFAERYMSLVAKFTGGKRVNFTTRGSYQRRCLGAALAYNSGPMWHLSMISSRTHLTSLCNKRERLRLQKQNAVHKQKSRTRQKAKTDCDENYGPNAQEALPDLEEADLQIKMNTKLKELQNDCERHAEIERQTVGQHLNPFWYDIRKDRVTASWFGTICLRRPSTSCHALIKQLLYSVCEKDARNLPLPLRYGRTNEEKAIRRFMEKTGLDVTTCGFFIYKENPYLGASPDGLIGEDAIIEVKCLYSIRDSKIKDTAKVNKKLCVEYNPDEDCVQLKKTHKYYYQVQGQLNITNRDKCYFVLFTNDDCEIIVINKDSDFWFHVMLPKLTEFWENCVLPELVDPRIPRGLLARDSPSILHAQH